jgi:hypothetical protein
VFRRIDRSSSIARFLEGLSAWLAKRRGLPIVIGVLLIVVSFVISLIAVYAPSPFLSLLWSLTHHLGIIIALIGLLLVQPLGS